MTDTVRAYIEKLEEALNKIAYPLKYLQNKAKKEGTILNGMMALNICQDANWLKQIAEDCLMETDSLKQQIEAEEKTVRSDERIDPEADKQAFGSGWENIK